jgi:hypothetical protein
MSILDKDPINLNVKPKPVREPMKPLSTAEKRLIAAVEAVPFKKRKDMFTDRQLTQYEQAKMRLGAGLKPSDAIKGEVKFGKIKRVPTESPKPQPPTQEDKDRKTVKQMLTS